MDEETLRRELREKTKEYRGKVPEVLLDSLIEWAVTGRHPGGFLEALLSNDLGLTLQFADRELLPEDVPLRQLYQCLFMHLPSGCHGSLERVRAWQQGGGYASLDRKED